MVKSRKARLFLRFDSHRVERLEGLMPELLALRSN